MTQSSKHIEIGKLTADEAERFAASFRPVWELDDAPFAQASKLSAAEMDALAGGAGIDVEIDAESKITSSAPRIPPPARHERHEDKVLVADAIPQPVPAPAPAAQPARRSSRPPAARTTARMAAQRPTVPDEDFAPIKKSNTGLFVGIGVVVVIISGIAIAKVAMKTEPTAATKPVTTAQQPSEQHEPRIPPPPPVVETDDKPAQVAKATPPQPTTQPTETAQAAPTQTQAAAIVKPQTTATQAPTATTAAAAGTTKPGGGTKPSNKGSSGGIVRETPF